MAYKRREIKTENPKVEMTPMIDVVFQLLIFFVVSLKHEDILSQLTAMRPATSQEQKREEQLELINVIVAPQGFVFNGRAMRLAELDRGIERLAGYGGNPMIIIKCTLDSPHEMLIQVLDICNKHGMTNLSIFSM